MSLASIARSCSPRVNVPELLAKSPLGKSTGLVGRHHRRGPYARERKTWLTWVGLFDTSLRLRTYPREAFFPGAMLCQPQIGRGQDEPF